MQRHLALLVCILTFVSGCESHTSSPAVENESQANPASSPTTLLDSQRGYIEQCAECHGNDGNLGRSGAPFIGGQHKEYVAFAMRGYINGLRKHPHMQSMVISLSHEEVDLLAEYYSQQPRKWHGLGIGVKTSDRTDNKAITHGKELAKSCAACHGENGISNRNEVPNLAGLDREYFISAVNAYIKGDRKDERMTVYKGTLVPADIGALASYYNSLELPQKNSASSPPKQIALLVKQCGACHGSTGSGAVPAIPHIAGQSTAYLTNSLRAYRDGQRKEKMMSTAASRLNDKQITALAEYFSKQPNTTIPFGKLRFGDDHAPLADGQLIAASCNGCHQTQLENAPNLNGLHPTYLQNAIKAYQTGERKHEAMKLFTQHLSELDVEKVSLYYASQTVTESSTSKSNFTNIEELINGCNACHGENGNSTTPATPTLAGLNTPYLTQAIKAYKNETRRHKEMKNAVLDLTEENIDSLASYYTAQNRNPLTIKLPADPKEIAAKCNLCHGENGLSENPSRPTLHGQSEGYLAKSLKDYQATSRDNSAMHAMTEGLSTLEIHSIANHYAKQK